MQILKAGTLYFALVFGAGFVLGPIRILWAVPRFGTRVAELMEAPIMLVVTILAGRWIVRRLAVPPKPSSRLGYGLRRPWPHAGRGVYACALASGSIDQRVSCKPRPCVGNGLLRAAWGVLHHAASRGSKMTLPIPIPNSALRN